MYGIVTWKKDWFIIHGMFFLGISHQVTPRVTLLQYVKKITWEIGCH